MADEMKIGMVVRLISGGPLMTVHSVGHEEACCVWFDGGVVRSDNFHMDTLYKVKMVERDGNWFEA